MNIDRIGTHHLASQRIHRSVGGGPARLLAGLVIVMTVLVGVDRVAAHSDAGEVTVISAEQSGPNRVGIEVGVVFADDGHIAEDAIVTATLVGPSGDTVGPVGLEQVDAESSLFRGQVDVTGPGSWALTVTSTNPDGTADTDVDVVAQAAEEPVEDTTTVPTEAPATTEVPVDGTGSAAGTPLDATADDGSSGDNRWLLVGAAFAAVALAAIVIVALRRNGDEHDDGDAAV